MLHANSHIEYYDGNDDVKLNVKDLAEMFDNFVLNAIKLPKPIVGRKIARHRFSTSQNGFTETILIDYENRSIKYFNQNGLNGKPVKEFKW